MIRTTSKKTRLITALLIGLVLGLVIVFGGFTITEGKAYASTSTDTNDFNVVQSKTDNVKRIELNNIQSLNKYKSANESLSSELKSYMENYNLDPNMVKDSKSIVIQEEEIEIDIDDEDYYDNQQSFIEDNGGSGIVTYGDSSNPDFSNTSQSGSMKFTIIAYQVGTTERGNKVYCIEAQASCSGYTNHKNDYFIIYGDSQTTFNSKYASQLAGKYTYNRYYKRAKKTLTGSSPVSINYSSNYGVIYSFQTPVKYQSRIGVIRGQVAKGNYYLTAINDCSVQVVYVHNTSTSMNLSISIGPVGISFDKTQHKDYRATPLSLYR